CGIRCRVVDRVAACGGQDRGHVTHSTKGCDRLNKLACNVCRDEISAFCRDSRSQVSTNACGFTRNELLLLIGERTHPAAQPRDKDRLLLLLLMAGLVNRDASLVSTLLSAGAILCFQIVGLLLALDL